MPIDDLMRATAIKAMEANTLAGAMGVRMDQLEHRFGRLTEINLQVLHEFRQFTDYVKRVDPGIGVAYRMEQELKKSL